MGKERERYRLVNKLGVIANSHKHTSSNFILLITTVDINHPPLGKQEHCGDCWTRFIDCEHVESMSSVIVLEVERRRVNGEGRGRREGV